MMKHIKKVLSAVLVLCMVLSLVPISVFAAGTGTESGTDDFYKIVHLDCGRKYFTKDWIIALIDEMAAEGYNQLQLAVGNDGLRFLLDNMSFTANDTTYSHDSVVSAVESGNMSQNSSGDSRWLTQTEMDGIISAANAKNIEIVPLLNLPGHANTILDIAGDQFNYLTSQNTLDVTNDSAVNFAYALFTKYVDYFAGKGCSFFNFGADEFANDIYSNSFAGLNTTRYNSFVSFINKLAAYIESKGMTPRAFNDGLYYGSWTSVSIDTNIQCCYWSSGWSSYNVASAQAIADKGHKMINTNGDFYYVLGKSDQFDSGSSYAANWDNAKFMGTTFTSEQAGSMFCIWCDYPNAETEIEIYTKVVTNGVLSAMSEAMGHMPETTEPEPSPEPSTSPEPTEPVDTLTDEATGVIANVSGLTSIAVAKREESTAYSGYTASVTYGITLNGGNYTGSAEIKIPYDANADVFVGCTEFIGSTDDGMTFPVALKDGYLVGTAPHFSDITISGRAATYAGTTTTYELATAVESGKSYLIVSSNSGNVYVLAADGSAVSATVVDNTITVDSQYAWTFTTNGNGFSIQDSYETFMYPDATRENRSWTYSLSTQQQSANAVTVSVVNNGAATLSRNISSQGKSTTSYVSFSSNSFSASGSQSTVYLFQEVEGYKVDNTALQEAITRAEDLNREDYKNWDGLNIDELLTVAQGAVDNNAYPTEEDRNNAQATVDATAEALKAALDGLVKYGTIQITIRYTAGDTIVKTETVDVKENATELTLSNIVGTDGETYVPDKKNLELSLPGTTVYTVPVTILPFDPNEVAPLIIEFWITNGRVYSGSDKSNTSLSISAADEGVYSEIGVDVTALIPTDTKRVTNDADTFFWRLRALDRITNEQTETAGDDESNSGEGFKYVRYYGGNWQFSNDRVYWTDVTNNQLVAYFMETTTLAEEVQATLSDWGFANNELWGFYPGTNVCTLSVQVVYEDGTTNPSSDLVAPILASTLIYGYWAGGRGIGTVKLWEIGDYEIYMVTSETGEATTTTTATSMTEGYVTVNSITWDDNETVVWNSDDNAKNEDGSVTISNPASGFSSEGINELLMWDENKEAIVLRVYVRAKQTEDSLTVHYIDQNANHEFYSYNIAVKKGIVFDSNFALEGGNLINNTVENKLGVIQTVTADLGKMSEIGAQYRYSSYTCVEVKRSDDGKDVYLYYTFDNTHNFVIDFGLPLKIDTTNLGLSAGDWTSVEVGNAIYGEVTDDISNRAIIYTPSVLPGVDSFTLTLIGSDKIPVTHTIYIYPATTVYYEEGFATYSAGWAGNASKGTGTQAAEIPGAVGNNNYGYDAKYAGEATGPSNGTQATSSNIGDDAAFTFTGTGVDIYANCTTSSGTVSILVRDAGTYAIVKLLQVNTRTGAAGTATTGQDVDSYSLPIASINGLDHGTYNVTIKHSKTDADDTGVPVSLDGFRVYNTLPLTHAAHSEDGVYYKDQEDDPTFIELRDEVLTAQKVSTDGSQYASQIAGQVYSASNVTSEGAIILSTSDDFTADDLLDLLDNGPKNEIFLRNGQSLVFKVTTNRVVQIGLKAINSTVSCTVNGSEENISSSTDMFYTVLNKSSGDATEQIITITNTSSGDRILSITKLKICDDPNATLGTLTAEDLIPALVSLGFEADPEEPAEPETPAEPTQPSKPGKPGKPGYEETVTADATLKVTVGNASVTLTMTGEKGKTATFTAAEIEKAANSLLANGYALKNAQFKDVTVTYGKSATVRFTAVRAQQVSAQNFGGRR